MAPHADEGAVYKASPSFSAGSLCFTPGTSSAGDFLTSTTNIPPDLTHHTMSPFPETIRIRIILDSLTKSAPIPDETYYIKSASSDTFLHCHARGALGAAPEDTSLNSIRWKCTRHGGWLGSQSVETKSFLGRDQDDNVICAAKRHHPWEQFVVEQVEGGAFIPRQIGDGLLYPFAIRHKARAEQTLAKMRDVDAAGYAFNFYRI